MKNKKIKILLQIGLVIIALSLLLFHLGKPPLIDYDEATYAKVLFDTERSGDFLSFKLLDSNWWEKPPLYFWLAGLTTKIFGFNEFALRFPSVILGVLCLWLVWLIVKELTNNYIIATGTFLILLFSAPFFYYIKEMRLDSGVIMAVLSALYFFIKGWGNNKYYLFVFPVTAIGFLFKSFIVFLAFPIIICYSFFYKKWAWLKEKYFWLGMLISLVIVAPWHIIQHLRFGLGFWREYIGRNVFIRAIEGYADASKLDYFSYFKLSWKFYQPWVVVFIIFLLYFIFSRFILPKASRNKIIIFKNIGAPLITTIFILAVFIFSKTHIYTYLLPAYPFIAMFMAMCFYEIFKKAKGVSLAIYASLIILSSLINFNIIKGGLVDDVIRPFHYEQKEVARIIKFSNISDAVVYLLDWPYPEAIRFYADTEVTRLNFSKDSGKAISAPFFLIVNSDSIRYFYNQERVILPEYEEVQVLYQGDFILLLFYNQDITLPTI